MAQFFLVGIKKKSNAFKGKSGILLICKLSPFDNLLLVW